MKPNHTKKPITRFVIRRGPWFCLAGLHWVRTEKAPTDVLVPIGQEICSKCKGKHVNPKT